MDFLLRGLAAASAIWCMVIFLLLVHETGHLILLALFKLKPDRIIIGNIRLFSITVGGVKHDFGLFPLFAFTISNAYARAPLRQRAIIAMAGPATSLILGGLLLWWNEVDPGWYTKMAAEASIALGVWNLIPFPPMDGWPILEWQLSRFGVKVSERGRSVLLGLGIVSIAVVAVLSWK